MSRLAYTVILTLAMPVLIMRLLWRSLRMPAYRARIGERFALHALQFASELRVDARDKLIWIHAVSVGEVAAAGAIDQGASTRVSGPVYRTHYHDTNRVAACRKPAGPARQPLLCAL